MNRFVAVCLILAGASACEVGDALQPADDLSGSWAGYWSPTRGRDATARSIAFEIEGSALVEALVRDQRFPVSDRRILFDDRENGRVYDEGEGLFRTTFELDQVGFFDVGFVLLDDRALVTEIGYQIGVLERNATETPTPSNHLLDGAWRGPLLILDDSNPDEAELERSIADVVCLDGRCEWTGRRSFTTAWGPSEASVKRGTVSGLSAADEALEVRAVPSNDGSFVAVSICSNDFEAAGLSCAYAALER